MTTTAEKPKRTDYHRDHYANNREKLVERKFIANMDREYAVSYWRQRMFFNRSNDFMIAKVPQPIIDRAQKEVARIYVETFGVYCVEKSVGIATKEKQ